MLCFATVRYLSLATLVLLFSFELDFIGSIRPLSSIIVLLHKKLTHILTFLLFINRHRGKLSISQYLWQVGLALEMKDVFSLLQFVYSS